MYRRSLLNIVYDQIYALLEEDYYRDNGYIQIWGEIYEVRFIEHSNGIEPYLVPTYNQVANASSIKLEMLANLGKQLENIRIA